MKYCNTCLYPDTKPDLYFDDTGKCSACLSFEARKQKDWNAWAKKFHILMRDNKCHDVYDCIVPVSGGKDSHYQVVKILQLGYNPLCINARTDDLSDLGRRNLDNIRKLGVDLIEVAPNANVRKKIAKYGLVTVGDISWGEHVSIFTVPFNMAAQFGIPLIIYGENPQNEYGAGPKGTDQVYELGYDWLQEFGGLNGLRLDDIINAGIATDQELFQYKMIAWKEPFGLSNLKSPKAIFLGQFFPWDGYQNALDMEPYGFEFAPKRVEGTPIEFENLDNLQTGIHDYFKYIKFGFGRTTDIVNNSIRRKIVSRKDAKGLILSYDGEYPQTYLDKSLYYILASIAVSPLEFEDIVFKFMNKDLFEWKYNRPSPLFLEDLVNA